MPFEPVYNPQYDLRNQQIENTYTQLLQYDPVAQVAYAGGQGQSVNLSASMANCAISSSYAATASYLQFLPDNAVSASYSVNSDTSSLSHTSSYSLSSSISILSLTSSQSISSSYAHNSTYALSASNFVLPQNVTVNTITASFLDVVGGEFTVQPPISSSALLFVSGGLYKALGYTYTFKVYSYKTTVYGRIYTDATSSIILTNNDPNDGFFYYLTSSWGASVDANGYRIVVTSDPTFGATGNYYFDTTFTSFLIGSASIGFDSVSSSSYQSGNTVTPSQPYAVEGFLQGNVFGTAAYSIISNYSLTSSYSVTSSYDLTSSYATTSSYAVTSDYSTIANYASSSNYAETSSISITSSYLNGISSSALPVNTITPVYWTTVTMNGQQFFIPLYQ